MSATPPLQIPVEKPVVLIIPAAGFDNPAQLRTTLLPAGKTIRVLLCLPEEADESLSISLAEMVKAIGMEMQILFHPKIKKPAIADFELEAPADISGDDQNEVALALSDIVLIVQASDPKLGRAARRLGKPVATLGAPLPDVFQEPSSITDGLDPKQPGWRSWGSSFFGRIEKAITELLAFEYREKGRAESGRQLKKCVSLNWRPQPYFAPDEWKSLAPDQMAVDPSSTVVACFEAMDRSAVHGSRVHRDLIWIAYLLAASAVLAAVAGEIWKGWAIFWGVTELVALVSVLGLIFWARRSALQDRWTACRLGAEQLRIARMSLPLLVLPPALATTVAKSQGSLALEEVKRVLRDHGLPRLAGPIRRSDAAKWLHCIVADQIAYHHRNHHLLDHAEKRLNVATSTLFFVALAAVIYHFISHKDWLLLLTAAGPAFAAALHGAGTRLGIVHRAALSQEMEQELRQVDATLTELIADNHPDPDPAKPLAEVRHLAFRAATAMGSENISWHGLVRRYRDILP
jgi:hypothetical protein